MKLIFYELIDVIKTRRVLRGHENGKACKSRAGGE